MTQEELDRQKFASRRIVTIADELLKKLEENERMIYERRLATGATSSLSMEFVAMLNQIIGEMRSPNTEDPRARLENVMNIIASVAKQLEETVKSSNDDVLRLEAIQEGMRRALGAVRESGLLQEKELEKIEALAETEGPESRRRVGEHPETMRTKRNASSLKKSRELSNI